MDAIEGLENGLTILLVAYRISTVQRSGKHGRPLALYSDHHSIFPKHETGDQTPTQFELALGELNIDSILASRVRHQIQLSPVFDPSTLTKSST